jgi:hypothetical protein
MGSYRHYDMSIETYGCIWVLLLLSYITCKGRVPTSPHCFAERSTGQLRHPRPPATHPPGWPACSRQGVSTAPLKRAARRRSSPDGTTSPGPLASRGRTRRGPGGPQASWIAPIVMPLQRCSSAAVCLALGADFASTKLS